MTNKSYKQALATPTDYSSNFTKVVKELCITLSKALAVEFLHDTHMDYSSSQTIELWIDKAHEPVITRSDASYGIRIFISSKGKFFAIRCIIQKSPRHWFPIPEEERDEEIGRYVQRIEQFLEIEGYISLPRAVLSQLTEGHKTRLDGFSATVFQVLFSEIT